MQIRQFARIAQNYAVQVSEIVPIAENLSRPIGGGAGVHRWIVKGEQSGLSMRTFRKFGS